MKGYGGNIYSWKVNKKDRLVYEIYEEVVNIYVISTEGHYQDKYICCDKSRFYNNLFDL